MINGIYRCAHLAEVRTLCLRWSSAGPLQSYERLLNSGKLRRDHRQEVIVRDLDNHSSRLNGYLASGPPKIHSADFLTRLSSLFHSRAVFTSRPPKGYYLYGGVGTGKTMLMDLFFQSTNVDKKRRTHFNAFMVEVHKRIHVIKEEQIRNSGEQRLKGFDAIAHVADEISEQVHLLCFDEFQVTDIADAMILKGLFTRLFENGVVVVVTSNRNPDDLYKNGLQRKNFLPFIDVLKKYCTVKSFDSDVDYRTAIGEGVPPQRVFFSPDDKDADREMDNVFISLTRGNETAVGPKVLQFLGRELTVPRGCGQIADFTFQDLCVEPLAGVDFVELCKHFHTILIRHVPPLSIAQRAEVRRFIMLIDNLYNSHVRLVMSSAQAPSQLFNPNTVEPSDKDNYQNMELRDELGLDADGKLSLFTGEEELFAFDRTVSRLSEMQTRQYWQQCTSNNILLVQ